MTKHFEGLGDKWRALVIDPANTDSIIKEQLVPTITSQGGLVMLGSATPQ